MSDRVSVVVAAYNAAATLPQTLASILSQTHCDIELLVVDDGSTDATPDVVALAASHDDRVVPVSYGANRGRSHARNAGMRSATGDWVAIVDADDLLDARRLEWMLDAAAATPGCRLVTDDRIGWRLEEGVVRVEHRFPGRHTWRVGGHRPLDRGRHFTDKFGQMDVLVQRSALEETGADYPEDMSIGEDLVFYLTLLFGEPDLCPVRLAEPTYYYRLLHSTRAAGGAEAQRVTVSRALERTGSAELRRLWERWEPAQTWLFQREDRRMGAAGRLQGADHQPAADLRTSPLLGFSNLLAVKALQWMGRFADRSRRPHIAADITAQLARTP